MITTRKIFRPLIEKRKRHQATIAMPNGLHQQLGQHTRCSSRLHAAAPVCANPGVDTGACLIDVDLLDSKGVDFLRSDKEFARV
jgi:hypothetical protein